MLNDSSSGTFDYKKYGDLILSPREIVNFEPLVKPLGSNIDDEYLVTAICYWVSRTVDRVGPEMKVSFERDYNSVGDLQGIIATIVSTYPKALGEMFGLDGDTEAVTITYNIPAMVAASAGYVCHSDNTTNQFWFKVGAEL